MKKIINLFQQDFKLLLRNAIFWVISVSLILIVLTANFLIPAEFSTNETTMIIYGMDIRGGGIKTAASPEEVRNDVKANGTVGIIYEAGKVTVVHDGLSDKAVAALVSSLTLPTKPLVEVSVETIREEAVPVPQNKRMMPVFISFEAIVTGFLMAAILLLGEKQETVLKAYRISPGGTTAYIINKVLLFAVVGMIYAAFMTILTVGSSFNWGMFLLLTLMGCVLYTLLGLCVAVFFKDISSWFFVATLILSLNMLPMISYSAPAFSPIWLQYIPSYSVLFAYSEVLFPSGKSIASTLTLLTGEIIAAAGLCGVLIKKKLLSAS
ncbi:MAG: hypothetical protein ACOYVK_11455 [Bacillota bacterium]